MGGLFEKDIRLMAQRGRSLIIFVFVMIIMGVSMDGAFIVTYGTMLFGIFTVGTLSYDEFDNCFPFLMTLPVTRKQYVCEKFLFCGGGVILGWIASIVIYAVIAAVKGTFGDFVSSIAESAAVLPPLLSIICVLIPVQLKYDVEKSRIVLIVVGGAVFGASAIFRSFLKGRDVAVFRVLSYITYLPDAAVLGGFIIIAVVVIAAMYRWSLKIMDKKAF